MGTKDCFSPDFKLGILGGGQLGKMLLAETRRLNIQTSVIDASKDAPAQLDCNTFEVGDILDYQTVLDFGRNVDLLTVEIENVNVAALQQLEKEGLAVYPSSETLRVIQNKAEQKLFYIDHNLPTADFARFAYSKELETAIKHDTLDFPFIWKSARFGYDGRGVKLIKTWSDLNQLPDVACITEKVVSIKKELAVIVARNAEGKRAIYPVTEMQFNKAHLLDYQVCPARLPKEITRQAELLALKVSEAFKHVGLLAIEMFLTTDNELLINEVAPRPHNSGHYTIDACATNQYEQHLRAILDLPLGDTALEKKAVMLNLVGIEGYKGTPIYENLLETMYFSEIKTYIYGKKETFPNRKMGHLTVTNSDVNKALEIALKIKEKIKVKGAINE